MRSLLAALCLVFTGCAALGLGRDENADRIDAVIAESRPAPKTESAPLSDSPAAAELPMPPPPAARAEAPAPAATAELPMPPPPPGVEPVSASASASEVEAPSPATYKAPDRRAKPSKKQRGRSRGKRGDD